jgi:hypothetical protein
VRSCICFPCRRLIHYRFTQGCLSSVPVVQKVSIAAVSSHNWMIPRTCRTVILMIRTWAVWERDRRLAIALPIFFVLIWCAICISATRYLSSLECMYLLSLRTSCGVFKITNPTVAPLPQPLPPSCFISGRSSIRLVEWVLVMGFEACMLFALSVLFNDNGQPTPRYSAVDVHQGVSDASALSLFESTFRSDEVHQSEMALFLASFAWFMWMVCLSFPPK